MEFIHLERIMNRGIRSTVLVTGLEGKHLQPVRMCYFVPQTMYVLRRRGMLNMKTTREPMISHGIRVQVHLVDSS